MQIEVNQKSSCFQNILSLLMGICRFNPQNYNEQLVILRVGDTLNIWYLFIFQCFLPVLSSSSICCSSTVVVLFSSPFSPLCLPFLGPLGSAYGHCLRQSQFIEPQRLLILDKSLAHSCEFIKYFKSFRLQKKFLVSSFCCWTVYISAQFFLVFGQKSLVSKSIFESNYNYYAKCYGGINMGPLSLRHIYFNLKDFSLFIFMLLT